VQRLADRQPSAVLQDGPQVVALDELEGDEVQPLVLAAEENAGDVLVIELGGAAGLLVEAADVLLVLGQVRWCFWVWRARNPAARPPTPMRSSNSKWASLRPRMPLTASSLDNGRGMCLEITVAAPSVESTLPIGRSAGGSVMAGGRSSPRGKSGDDSAMEHLRVFPSLFRALFRTLSLTPASFRRPRTGDDADGDKSFRPPPPLRRCEDGRSAVTARV
jgi:hypothetical protein